MRQPVGHDAECTAGGGVNVDLSPAELLYAMVVAVRDADVDTGAAAGEAFGWNARVFERTPRDLQQQPLLRIHQRGFTRRDSEKASVERGDVAQQAGAPSDRLARRPGRRIVDRVDVPAIGRYLDDRVASPGEELPRASVDSMPPGNEQPMPTMAIWSVDFEMPAVCSMRTAPVTQARCEAGTPPAPGSGLRRHERAHSR